MRKHFEYKRYFPLQCCVLRNIVKSIFRRKTKQKRQFAFSDTNFINNVSIDLAVRFSTFNYRNTVLKRGKYWRALESKVLLVENWRFMAFQFMIGH